MTVANIAHLVEERPRAALRMVSPWVVALAFFGIAGMGCRLVYLTRPFNSDASMFILMGKVMNEGGKVGVDFCDNKFPTVGLVTGVFWRAFGNWWPAYVLAQTALVLLAIAILARAIHRHMGADAALATTCFALVAVNFTTFVFGGFELETFLVVFAMIAAAAATEMLMLGDWRDAFLVGFCGGMAIYFKPTGAAVVVAAFVAAIMAKKNWRLLAAMVAGVTVPLGAAIVSLWALGQLTVIPPLVRQISRYARESAFEVGDLYKLLVVGTLLGFPLLVRGWICRRDRLKERNQPQQVLVVFTIAWLVLELLGVLAQRRMYPYHFLVLTGPVALLFGMIPRWTTAWRLAAQVGPIALLSMLTAVGVVDPSYRGQKLALSDYLLARCGAGDSVWREDCARVILETGLRCGSRYPLTFLMTNHDDAPVQIGRQILTDFKGNKPRYVVLFTNFDDWLEHQCEYYTELRRRPARRENYLTAWRAIRDYVHANYQVEAVVGEETIWRRK